MLLLWRTPRRTRIESDGNLAPMTLETEIMVGTMLLRYVGAGNRRSPGGGKRQRLPSTIYKM